MDFNRLPAIAIWEITQACALACLHCRAEARPWRDPLELSTKEGFRLIDQLAAMGTPLLVLTGGDPAERPDVVELIRYGAGRGLKVALSPSATAKVTWEKLVELKDAGVHRIALSLDGPDAQTHDAFRGVAGSFMKTLEIARYVRSLSIPLQIGTTMRRSNAHQLEAIAELVQFLGVILWSVFFLVPTGRAQRDEMMTADTCESLLEQLADLSSRVRFAIKTTEAPHYRRVLAQRTGCNRPAATAINDGKGFIFVSHRGDVYPSGFLPLKAGNVRESRLEDIYREAGLLRALRDSDALKGKCGRCSYRATCGGSRARAYALTGDPLGPDPLCAYQPAAG